MEGGAWWAAVHGVTKSWTPLSNVTFNFHFHTSEKEMATHSSVLAWRIPGTGEPGGLPSMGSHRVRHNWSDLAAAATYYKISTTSDMQMVSEAFLRAESEEELKSLLMRVKEEMKKLAWNSTFKNLRSWHPVHRFMANRWGKCGSSDRVYFPGL